MKIFSTSDGIEDENGELYAERIDEERVVMTVENDFIHKHYAFMQLSIIKRLGYIRMETYENESLTFKICSHVGEVFDIDIYEINFEDFFQNEIEKIKDKFQLIWKKDCLYVYAENIKVFIGLAQDYDHIFIYRNRCFSDTLNEAIAEYFDKNDSWTAELHDYDTIYLSRHQGPLLLELLNYEE